MSQNSHQNPVCSSTGVSKTYGIETELSDVYLTNENYN